MTGVSQEVLRFVLRQHTYASTPMYEVRVASKELAAVVAYARVYSVHVI